VERRHRFKCLYIGALKSYCYARHAYPTVNWSVAAPHGIVRLLPEEFSSKSVLEILLKTFDVFGFLLKSENKSGNST
jgi:hypothetical protein